MKKYTGKWLELTASNLILRTTDKVHPSGVNIIPFNSKKLVLISNYRIPVSRGIIEIPAGLSEVGLTLEENAFKELREETGVR